MFVLVKILFVAFIYFAILMVLVEMSSRMHLRIEESREARKMGQDAMFLATQPARWLTLSTVACNRRTRALYLLRLYERILQHKDVGFRGRPVVFQRSGVSMSLAPLPTFRPTLVIRERDT